MITSVPYPPQEGIGAYSYNLALALRSHGAEVTLLTRGGTLGARRERVGDIPLVRLPYAPLYPVHVHLHSLALRRYLAASGERFDVIHAHSPLPAVPWGTGLPLVTTIHSAMQADARATKVEDLQSLLIRLQTPVSASIERALLRRSGAVAVVSPQALEMARRYARPGVPVRVLGNGVDTAAFLPDLAAERERLVLCIGRLAHGKGVEDLLAAWPSVLVRHPDAALAIVGGGPLEGRLRRQAEELGVAQSVRFPGVLGRDEIRDLYQRASLVAQPSHHEGLSTVVLEGMASGAVVVATAVGAHPDVIRDGVNGYLIEPGNPAELGDRIAAALDDPTGAARMGAEARRTVEERYSWDSIAAAYVEAYEAAIAGGTRAR
jgi:glycosyltransferase involved in cell wall biosynthesis